MFGTKEVKYWNSTKGILAEMLNLESDSSDAEIVDAAMEWNKEANREARKQAANEPQTQEKGIVKVEDFEGLKSLVQELSQKIAALEKRPSSNGTEGKKATEGKKIELFPMPNL